MIQDNAVRQADMTIKQLLCCVPTDTNTVCRIGLLVQANMLNGTALLSPAMGLGYWTSPSRMRSTSSSLVWRYGLGLRWSVWLWLLAWRTRCNSDIEPAEAAWCRLRWKELERGLLNKLREVTHIPSLAPSPYTYLSRCHTDRFLIPVGLACHTRRFTGASWYAPATGTRNRSVWHLF